MKWDWVTPRVVRGVALGSVVANVGIVITGGAVRLTGSGMGCPTWPTCTADSFTPTGALGIHGVIEFTNRTLASVVSLFAIAGVLVALAVLPSGLSFRHRVRNRSARLAIVTLLGIPAQIILGMITVATNLNPWVVGCHFLLSIAVIAAAYAFWRSTREGDSPPAAIVPGPLRLLAAGLLAVTGAVLMVGTVVTGSGPHAGDVNARRNGLASAAVSQVHADLVFLLIGLAVATWLAFRAVTATEPAVRAVTATEPAVRAVTATEPAVRAVTATEPAVRAVTATEPAVRAAWLVGVILGQGLIGFLQYATHLPAILVGAHLAGACLVWLAALSTWYATRTRGPAPASLRDLPGSERFDGAGLADLPRDGVGAGRAG